MNWLQKSLNILTENICNRCEARTSIRMGQTCEAPIAIEAQPIANNTGSTQTTHIDIDIGFYCINEEQANNELCGEFEVRYCCPRTSYGSCDQKKR